MRKTALALIALLLLTGCAGGASEEPSAAVDLEQESQRASYAQGFQIGHQGQSLPIEVEPFLAGIRDGLAGSGQLDDEQLQVALADFNRLMTDARNAEAETNLAEGDAWLAENAERPEVVVTESGLQYEVLREGDGPRPSLTDVVSVHYTGTLLDGTEFDSSRDGDGQPATFPLGNVIAGWQEGVQLMPVGSIFKFYIPGPLAYGEAGRGELIGPNDTLVFEVELLEIVER